MIHTFQKEHEPRFGVVCAKETTNNTINAWPRASGELGKERGYSSQGQRKREKTSYISITSQLPIHLQEMTPKKKCRKAVVHFARSMLSGDPKQALCADAFKNKLNRYSYAQRDLACKTVLALTPK